MNTVVTPSLYCPFPTKVNEHIKQAEQHTNEWVIKFNLLQNESAYKNFYAAKFFELAAYFFPDAPFEEFKIVTDWSSWVFIWDDQCDMLNLGQNPDLLKIYQTRLLEVLKGYQPNHGDIPLAWALKDIRDRILAKASKPWFCTFIRVVEDYFNACIWEANNRMRKQIPGVDIYIEKRVDTGAAYTIFKLLEFTQQIFLPEAIQEHFFVKELAKIANNVICWSNDIFSLHREMKQGDVHNLVLAIKNEQRLSLDQAIKEAARLNITEAQSFLDFDANLPKFGEEIDAKLRSYILGLRYCIGGNLDWSAHTYRYQTNAKGFLQATAIVNPSLKTSQTASKSDKNLLISHRKFVSQNSNKIVSKSDKNLLPKFEQILEVSNEVSKVSPVVP